MSDIVKPTKKELVDALKNLNDAYSNLPQIALHIPVSHGDLSSLIAILCGIYELEIESK